MWIVNCDSSGIRVYHLERLIGIPTKDQRRFTHSIALHVSTLVCAEYSNYDSGHITFRGK